MTQSIQDFTERAYGVLLDKARGRFSICPVDELSDGDGIALWRHDIDFSPHRALALAQMEAAREVAASYFVMLSSSAYNVFESGIRDILRTIVSLGHEIGLHFDVSIQKARTIEELEDSLRFEAGVLERLLGVPIRSFSIHNPTVESGVKLDDRRHVGLVNASAPSLYAEFVYSSDSNGLWRFRPLAEVIDDQKVRSLYVLTHPEWWQVTFMPSRCRIQRCIDGRAASTATEYDALLAEHRRPNVGVDFPPTIACEGQHK